MFASSSEERVGARRASAGPGIGEVRERPLFPGAPFFGSPIFCAVGLSTHSTDRRRPKKIPRRQIKQPHRNRIASRTACSPAFSVHLQVNMHPTLFCASASVKERAREGPGDRARLSTVRTFSDAFFLFLCPPSGVLLLGVRIPVCGAWIRVSSPAPNNFEDKKKNIIQACNRIFEFISSII